MSLSDVLTIALGLVFTYALLSMLASVIKEAIAAKLQWRAKGLRAAISDMLAFNGQSNAAWGRLSERVYGHAMVSGISQNDRPSYLAARNFTLALLDELSGGSQAPIVTAVEGSVQSLPTGELKQRLTVLINESAGDAEALKQNVDKWFDDSMDRLSGTYKRSAQVVLFLIGIAVAIALNVNTLRIVNLLEHSAEARTQTAEMAEAFHKNHSDSPATTAEIQDAIATLPIPIGWTSCSAAKDLCEKEETWQMFDVVVAEGRWDFVSELIGWLLTGIAISFGAPFWFDLMGQLINNRSSGPKPPRADAQAGSVAD